MKKHVLGARRAVGLRAGCQAILRLFASGVLSPLGRQATCLY